jgi:phospholipid/cholesterol/gamma-HCH transport system substrate-binding protein
MGIRAVDERIIQFRIGVMVLATLLITAIMVFVFKGSELLVGTYTVYINFDEAPGVTEKTPIRKSGITIGRVTEVKLQDDGKVRVTAAIENGQKIFDDEQPQLTRSLLTNDAVIEFRRKPSRRAAGRPEAAPPAGGAAANGGRVAPIAEVPAEPREMPMILTAFQMTDNQPASPAPAAAPALSKPPAPRMPSRAPVAPNAEIRGEVAPDITQAMAQAMEKFSRVDLDKAVNSITSASENINKLAGTLNSVLGSTGQKEQLAAMLDNATDTMNTVKNAANTINEAVGNPSIKQAMDDLPKVMGETRKTLTQMNNAIDLVDRNLQSLDTFTQALGDKGPSTLGRIDQAADRLDHLMCQLSSFGDALNGDKGSLGQLLHNPDLYDNLNRAAGNIKDLTVQLQPIIHDARVFSDKIARHPETLGVRGAIKPSTGAKGMPLLPPLGGSSGSSDDPYQDRLQLRFDRN